MRLAAQKPNLYICDFAALQHKFGRDAVFNPAVYTNTEMILSLECIPYFASRIVDIICAARGQIKKCLVIDLDNTIWGGVIGDDGIENIQLGHGLGIGKAFTEFQRWIKKLKARGIIIAVCSKNNEDTAKEPFIKHPEMVLRLDDIAVFVANWQNKADNIRRIQSILNIGFDSFVFLDDNPAERAIVRESIEGITVPELPEDPACYLEYLYGLNLFETAGVSEEDARRTEQYKAEAERSRAGALFTSEQEFLKSLRMRSVVRGFDSFTIPRAAQLSQRSNQFNLRTVRYTEADAKRIADDSSRAAFTFTLADRFGDNGLICVIALEKQGGGTLFIENWFMSCRVLKRGMENFAVNTIVGYAKENGFKRILGEYIPTAKNGMTSGHYQGLGFTPVADEKRKLYELMIDGFEQAETEITRSEQ